MQFLAEHRLRLLRDGVPAVDVVLLDDDDVLLATAVLTAEEMSSAALSGVATLLLPEE